MTLRMPRTYDAEQKTFSPIQAYPELTVERASAVSIEWPIPLIVAWMSAQAATTELSTIKPNESSVIGVTRPPNQSTSPYATTIIARFLKMVKTGTERNWRALAPV